MRENAYMDDDLEEMMKFVLIVCGIHTCINLLLKIHGHPA